jgi:hypothetical protein
MMMWLTNEHMVKMIPKIIGVSLQLRNSRISREREINYGLKWGVPRFKPNQIMAETDPLLIGKLGAMKNVIQHDYSP